METAEFSLADLIHGAIADVASVAQQHPATGIQLVDASLPGVMVSDPARLRETLGSMLCAAIRFSSRSPVKLFVFTASLGGQELELNFEVTAENERLDESRALACLESESESGEAPLAAGRRFAQLLGGDMGVQCEARRVTFWSRIPVHVVRETAAKEARIPEKAIGEARPSRENIRILMAEDNLINQRVGKLILDRAGFIVDLVADGNEALDAHHSHPYDVILMDCQMPIMDGFEATRMIRSLSQRQPIIIAVTANALVGERERCLVAGMDDYLSKPFQAEQLVSIVQKWVAVAKARR